MFQILARTENVGIRADCKQQKTRQSLRGRRLPLYELHVLCAMPGTSDGVTEGVEVRIAGESTRSMLQVKDGEKKIKSDDGRS